MTQQLVVALNDTPRFGEQALWGEHDSPEEATAAHQDGSGFRAGGRGFQLTGRDLVLLRWIGEQYCARGDLIGMLMARHSESPTAQEEGRVAPRLAQRRVAAWRSAGLVNSAQFVANTAATVWLTGEGMTVAGLGWRASAPTFATVAHRHAVGVVRAYAEAADPRSGWVSERELRDGLDHPAGGRRDHLPDGLITSADTTGRIWRSAIEVELTRKTRPRVEEILRGLLARYDDVIYFAVAAATGTVTAAAAAVSASERVRVRSYPPQALAAVA